MTTSFRATTQVLLPARPAPPAPGQYDLYPAFPCDPGAIALGYDALAGRLAGERQVTLDGYGGVLWDDLRERLTQALARRGQRATWLNVDQALRSGPEIEALVGPFLGGDDPLFGTRFTGQLRDFFDPDRLARLQPDAGAALSIVYGCGAALCGWEGLLVYVELPKNEIQFRSRAGTVRNLGAETPRPPKEMYKRFYFVDWVALNRHKVELAERVDVVVDGQRPDEPACMAGSDLRAALKAMSRNYFRVRPWFEPGPWGGQWIKAHIPQLPQAVPNYAWSFELISPENGLLLASDGVVLEVAFDWLMFCQHREVLGRAAERFGLEFPIRFDFLDTFDGGNLSVQCHPRPDYIRRHFGESFTQDETYYILDCAPGAQVYLGFRDDVDPAVFRAALERSYHDAAPLEVERFVHREPAHRHDLFLIPNGTIHCSGANNLVLEISATPYIFTFKMYDWLRMDLDGRPRALNIERACDNLYFERRGARVTEELVSRPRRLAAGDGWACFELPTHPEHFYAVRRYEFQDRVRVETGGACHVMSLVEGAAITLETALGLRQRFSYAETFVVPAAAESYTLINEGPRPAKVVQSFVKDSAL
jgi:mannose-6-phosphate isomerase class I